MTVPSLFQDHLQTTSCLLSNMKEKKLDFVSLLQRTNAWWPSQSPTSSGTVSCNMVFSSAISILGSPVADAEGCREIIEDRTATVCIFWEELLEIQDPHVAFHLLLLCASTCHLLYLLRTTPPHITKPQSKEFDLGMRRVLENLHG